MLIKKVYSVLAIILLLLTVIVTVHTSASGSELAYLENTEEKLGRDNSELSSQLVAESSLSQLSQSALSLGFNKPQDTVYLSADNVAVGLLK